MAIYQSKVLEGNWFEELEYKREEIRNYLEKKERGQLETVKKSLHKSLLNPTKLEPNHSDNYVRYDETVLILNQASEGCLATNILDPCPAPLKDMYNVTTTSLHMFPCVRNCWRLKRRGAGSNSDILRYEDEFMIVTTEKLVEYPFYLTSLKGDITSVSKVSRNQLVAIEHNSTSNTIWRIQHPDPSKRLNAYQQPVELGAPVLIEHVMSGNYLCSDKIVQGNEFGKEWETFAKKEVKPTTTWYFVNKPDSE